MACQNMLVALGAGLAMAMAMPWGVVGGPLPSAVWPPPVAASCTGSAGSAFSSSLSFHFSGHGENSPVARNASARYLPILTEGASASGEISGISVFVGLREETLGLGTDYGYEISVDGSEVQVSARSPFGVAYGLETLSQFIVYGTFQLNFHRFDRFELDLRGRTQP